MDGISFDPNPPSTDEDLKRYVYDEFQRIRDAINDLIRNNDVTMLEISEGKIRGYSYANKFGSNEDIDVGTEDVWEHGGLVNWPPSASVMNVTSLSANDTSAGTGARTIIVEGLDSNWDEISETVTMTGQVIVNTIASFIRVHRVYVVASGSGETNADELHVFTGTETAGLPDDPLLIYSTVSAGHGQSLQCFYTVPRGKTAYMTGFYANTDDTSKLIIMRGFFRAAADTATATWRIGAELKFGGHMQHFFSPYPAYPEKTDMRMEAEALSNNTYVAGGFDLVLVDNA